MYRLHNNILIVGVLTIGFLAVMVSSRALCMMTLVTLFAFVTQVLLILYFVKVFNERSEGSMEKPYDTSDFSSRLFWAVLLYSILIGAIFMAVSYYYDGDTFLFSKRDAMFYYNAGIDAANNGYFDNAKHLIRTYEYEELGGLLSISLILYILPEKLFLNAVYMTLGSLSSVMLYRIGKRFMPDVYSFCGALAYGCSSFTILFHCTCLKESIFIFLVISAMYFFYRSISGGGILPVLGLILSAVAVVFFRPAVTAFLVASFVSYFAITQRGSAVSLFLVFTVVIGLAVSLAFMQQQVDHYTRGDTDRLIENSSHDNYSGSFNYFVGWFAAPFGPFPTLFPKEGVPPSTINFYGAGLLHRLFLVIPFWMGMFFTVKNKKIIIIPLAVFVLIEMVATAYVTASIELRKVLPHVPFMYILTFYGLYQWDSKEFGPYVKKLMEPIAFLFAIGILVFWNVVKVKA